MRRVDESWFREGVDRAEKAGKVDRADRAREEGVMAGGGEGESDGEEGYSGCCFLPGRAMSGRLAASGSGVKGGGFVRLSGEDREGVEGKGKGRALQRSRSVCATIFFCCRSREERRCTTVEVRAVDGGKEGRKWEVDVDEEHIKPPYWKQLVRKVRSQCRPRVSVHKAGSEWLNYDAQSYQMNFDDGCWRENCSSFLYADEGDDSATRARAMHEALFKKFAASRTLQDSPGLVTNRSGSR
ncbi:hypothetical protein M758_8G154800 [Ceratodon purpureus]|nr:hypothetical protein M758_8G154800 [Ceratodon purpureus]